MPDIPSPRVLVDVDGLLIAARLRIIAHHLGAMADDLERLETAMEES